MSRNLDLGRVSALPRLACVRVRDRPGVPAGHGAVRLTVALLGGRMGASQRSVEEGGMGGTEAQGDAAAGRSSGTEAQAAASGYLLAGQASELERLQLQSRVWEPSGRRLLEEIGDGGGARALAVSYTHLTLPTNSRV